MQDYTESMSHFAKLHRQHPLYAALHRRRSLYTALHSPEVFYAALQPLPANVGKIRVC